MKKVAIVLVTILVVGSIYVYQTRPKIYTNQECVDETLRLGKATLEEMFNPLARFGVAIICSQNENNPEKTLAYIKAMPDDTK